MAEEAYLEQRSRQARCSPARAFQVLAESLGGSTLPGLKALWAVRRRLAGKRAAHPLRVVKSEPPRRLVLEAAIDLPGQVQLEYRFEASPAGTKVTQECRFTPSSWRGRLYWKAVSPAHRVVFRAMLHQAVRCAEQDGSAD